MGSIEGSYTGATKGGSRMRWSAWAVPIQKAEEPLRLGGVHVVRDLTCLNTIQRLANALNNVYGYSHKDIGAENQGEVLCVLILHGLLSSNRLRLSARRGTFHPLEEFGVSPTVDHHRGSSLVPALSQNGIYLCSNLKPMGLPGECPRDGLTFCLSSQRLLSTLFAPSKNNNYIPVSFIMNKLRARPTHIPIFDPRECLSP